MNKEKLIELIDENTTLFLDRDGVINVEKENDYIKNVEEFVFYEGVKEHFNWLNQTFKTIVIVTNQKGIGKGLMTENDLHKIHDHLNNELQKHNAVIHKFYYAPSIENDSEFRKPNIGMAFKAKNDFPDIDFNNSIMVGNNLSDMEFGKRIGAKTVLVETTQKVKLPHGSIDFKFENFVEFCKLFRQ